MKLRYFTFGVDISPSWFLQKIESKDVEYIHEGGVGKVVACRFYDTLGHEKIITIGQLISNDMLPNS